MQPIFETDSDKNEEDEYPVVVSNKKSKESLNNERIFIEKTEGAGEILFGFFKEIEDFI